MPQLFSNAARSTLAADITATDKLLLINSTDSFPLTLLGTWYYLTLQDSTGIEIVKVTGLGGNSIAVTRAQQGTTAKAFASGTVIGLRITAGDAITLSSRTLSSEIQHIWASSVWKCPSDGYVRVCLCSAGGGGYGGGASALAFWRWRKISIGQSLTFSIGAGTAAEATGGKSTVAAPWGGMSASPGGGGGSVWVSGNGGTGGGGGDYYYNGGNGWYGGTEPAQILSSAGGTVNPFNLPKIMVSGSIASVKSPTGQDLFCSSDVVTTLSSFFPISPPGWLSIITGVDGVGTPGYVSVVSVIPRKTGNDEYRTYEVAGKYGGGGSAINPASGSGFAIIEYCQLMN